MASDQVNRCVNCGHKFTGNYCPCCSQKSGVGRLTWNSVHEGMMEVWGLNSRSLTYSLWQLIFRPGYFISDYINGKRQVSFPPVKMLVLVSLVSVLIDKLRNHVKTVVVDTESMKPEDVTFSYAVNDFFNWFHSNPGWGWLLINSFLLIPTWFIFRRSPRNAKHTLPQGFFILVFLSIEVLVYDCLADCITGFITLMMPLCYLFTYKQLFGYSMWGTFWRANVVVFCGLLLVVFGASLYFFYLSPKNIGENISASIIILIISILLIGLGVLFDWLGYRRRENKMKKKFADKQNAAPQESMAANSDEIIEPEETKY